MRLLVLDQRGQSVSELIEYLHPRTSLDRVHPEDVRRASSSLASEYDGVLATGGFLKSESRGSVLQWYREFFAETDRPFLGICLGMKILGFCYGARMRRIESDVGLRVITFEREFPLAPGIRTMAVHENHRYELVPPLPDPLQNYANGGSPVQAMAVTGRPQFAVQFHPEVGSTATIVLDSFLELCRNS